MYTNTKIMFSKIASALTIFMMVVSLVGPITANAVVTIKPHENDKTFLELTCDAVSVNGNVWTLSGTWTAYNFGGQSTQYDTAVFSPSATLLDDTSKDNPDTFVTLNGPSDYADDLTPPNKDDMDGTWSNQVIFNSLPTSISAALYHAKTPGNEISADATCTFEIPNACEDGADNDNDGNIDFPADLGCTDANDNDESGPVIIPNVAPTANAGVDQTITLPTSSVNLDGSASTDSDGTVVSYDWSVVSGPSAPTITDVVNPSVSGLVAGTYVFGLTVTDDDAAVSTQDTVSITVNPVVVLPQCSDTIDNDGDGFIDFPADPGCTDAQDNSELPVNIFGCMNPLANNYNPNATNDNQSCTFNQCVDGIDNADAEDVLVDANDPGCWTDPNNSQTYNPQDNDETDPTDVCTNIAGFQLTMPEGYAEVSAGICMPDLCPNIADVQTSVPVGMEIVEGQCVALPQCSDTVDNADAEDVLVDANDPGCWTDPNNSQTYNPEDNDETTPTDVCPNDAGIQTNVEQCSPLQCQDQTFSNTYVSDTGTMVGVNPAVLLTTINAGWTAMISGASWIWSTDPVVTVADPATETETFTETFNVDKVNDTITGGSLMIAVDNSYSVTLNGNPLCSDSDLDNVPPLNYSAAGQDVCPILAGDLLNGSNTLSITVTNEAHGDSAASNPAGLIYKLTIDGNECVPPPPPLDVCLNVEGNQSTVPMGYKLVGEGQCVVTQCYDDVDNSDGEDSLVDEMDPGCHTDGNANNSESYNPNDDDESNTIEEENTPECSDGIDNDNDSDIDYGTDVGCDSPEDNDEGDDEGGGSSSSGTRRSTGGGGSVLGAATDVCTWNTQYARLNWKGNVPDQIQTIQNFLNLQMNAGLVVDSKFGPKTAAAVGAFQDKYASEILAPWGITKNTKIWYISTTTKAKELMCGEKQTLPPLINWSQNPAVR